MPGRDRSDLEAVAAAIGLSDATVEALAKEHGRARLIRERTYIHLAVQALEADGEKLATRELDLVAGPNLVLSVHDGPIEALDLFAEHFHGDTLLGRVNAGSFLAALGDSVATTWFERIEEIEREIDHLDETAMRGPDGTGFLDEVLQLRRRIAGIRRTLAPHREAFSQLARPDFELDERLGKPLARPQRSVGARDRRGRERARAARRFL